jgi:hypothetical protein
VLNDLNSLKKYYLAQSRVKWTIVMDLVKITSLIARKLILSSAFLEHFEHRWYRKLLDLCLLFNEDACNHAYTDDGSYVYAIFSLKTKSIYVGETIRPILKRTREEIFYALKKQRSTGSRKYTRLSRLEQTILRYGP